jgi:hypothetical protein
MSWIFGIAGSYSDTDLEHARSIHDQPLYSIQMANKYIAAGGLHDTCLCCPDTQEDAGWFLCGIGISESYTLFSPKEWKEFIHEYTTNDLNRNKPAGHYICVAWQNDNILCFNDTFGLRELYITQREACIAFSTNLKWLAQFRGDCKLDSFQFGSGWLLFNQLSNKSVLSDIDRLGAGGNITIENHAYSILNNYWSPNAENKETFPAILEKYVLLPLHSPYTLSLSLSGGLDSRTILSVLLSSKHRNWQVHSFGNPEHPDVTIASQIAHKFKLEHQIIYEPLPPAHSCLHLLETFIATSAVHIPASEVMDLQYYLPLQAEHKLVIDGGFGEIARRQYLNRLLLKGKKAIIRGDATAIISHLLLERGEIFDKEVLHSMYQGIIHQIDDLYARLPDPKETGVENWLDMLSIHTRLPNYFGFSQVCADQVIMNYMPFAQPKLLSALFKLKINVRKNGKLLKQIIETNFPELTKFNLVKFNNTYPFQFSTLSSYAWTKIKKRAGYAYQDNERMKFLNHLCEFIKDTVHSKGVKEYPLYNYSYITNLIHNFYKGDTHLQNLVDWWLSFEIFRQNTRINA